jgi:hypothetical protein
MTNQIILKEQLKMSGPSVDLIPIKTWFPLWFLKCSRSFIISTRLVSILASKNCIIMDTLLKDRSHRIYPKWHRKDHVSPSAVVGVFNFMSKG